MNPYQMNSDDVCKELNTHIKHGLSEHEAQKRLTQYGPNALPEKDPVSIIALIFRQLLSPLMFVLIFAAAASLLIGELSDSIVIGIAALINIVIGFFQEWKADRAAQALRSFEVPQAVVRREEEEKEISARELVPGDIVVLQQGARVPADIRLTYVSDFQVEEALLTGESAPITKTTETVQEHVAIGDRTNIAHAGTYAIKGKAEGIVVATGHLTALGDIAQLVTQTQEQATPLQEQIKRFSWLLGAMMAIITVFIVILGMLKGFSFYEITTIAIALAVAAIPEGLLVAVTVILAIGMQRMLKRKALVRHLVAAETLGSVSVICTDKTGTLTQGRMAVVKISTPEETIETDNSKQIPENIKHVLQACVLNNDAQVSSDRKHRMGSPTEVALLESAFDYHIDRQELQTKYPRVKEAPFSSDTKYMATVHTQPEGKEWLIVKGAPERVIAMCENAERRAYYDSMVSELTEQGLRVLAVAESKDGPFDLNENISGLTFLGLLGLQDPLRPRAAQTVKELNKAGIRVVIVTGDHKQTALRIAKGAGVSAEEDGVVTGVELDELSDEDFEQQVREVKVFARVDPRHKIRIVQAWKRNEQTVAMTGDGVNDAPALKAADIGVALGSGSDVSHEIADMVLLDNNLSTITAAVLQGRIIFDNIRKVIAYLMVDSFSEIALILFALVAGFPLPITAVQILWINLVTDGLPHIALTMEPGEKGIMSEPPRRKDEPVLNSDMIIIIFVIGLATDIGLCGLFWFLLQSQLDLQHIQTMIFTALGLDSLLYVFSIRSMRRPIIFSNPFSNKWLVFAVLAGFVIQLSSLHVPFLQKLLSTVPLQLYEWGIIAVLSLVKIICIEATKIILIRRRIH